MKKDIPAWAVPAGVLLVLAIVTALILLHQKIQRDEAQRRDYLRRQQAAAARQQFINALPKIDIADWCGRPPDALARRFFGGSAAVRDCCKGGTWNECSVSGWNGCKDVLLSFAARGLREVTFTLPGLFTEQECEQIVMQKFGLALPRAKYVASTASHGYKGLSGKVYSVHFDMAEGQAKVTLLMLAPATENRGSLVPGSIRILFNWYVDGTDDRRTYTPPTPWP